MEKPEILKKLEKDYAEAKLQRSPWQDHWSQLRRWCHPNSPDFNSSTTNILKGQRKHDEIYDSTAPWALDQFASGLSSVLTDLSTRWFGLGVQGTPFQNHTREEREYLEFVSDRAYFEFALPDSHTYGTLHENYIDIGCFGTCAQFQSWDEKNNHLHFRSCPLADTFIFENSDKAIDKVFYRENFTTRQLLHEWPHLADLRDIKDKVSQEKNWEIVHAVFPREERNLQSFLSINKPYASFYFSPDLPVVLEESGFDYFPYNIARWTKIPGETYGRSPGMSVLPDIRTLNQMQKEMLVSAQLANNPPIVADDDSILLPLSGDQGTKLTVAPKSILWKEQGAEFPQPLNSGMQPQLTLEMMDGLRESIQRAFFVDHLIRAKKKERQTTTEILDDRGEMMRQLQPHFGRINSELLDNMIKTTYFMLDQHNELPDPPASLAGRPLEILYFSPASKAQLGTKAQNMSAFMQDITPLINVNPQIAQRLDDVEMLNEYAMARDIPTKIIKDARKIKEEEESQAQQAQQAQALEAAPQMAKAAKDIAEARQKDPSLIPELPSL